MARKSKKVRIGVIGAGGIARNAHIGNYQKLPEDVELVAVCDIDKARAESYADQFGFKRVYTDWKKAVKDPDVDAFSICTPNAFHKGPTVAALGAGKHVLCEKPMATTYRDAVAMVDAAKKHRRKLMIALHHHYNQSTQVMKQIIDEGTLGRIYYSRVQTLRVRGVPSWGLFTNKKAQGGGPMVDIGVHMLYVALYLLGFPRPVSVTGMAWDHIGKSAGHFNPWGAWDPKKYEVEDLSVGLIRFADGSALQIEASWALNIPENIWNVQIMGDKAGMSSSPLQIVREEGGAMSVADVQVPKGPGGHELEIRAFVDAIKNNKPVPIPADKAILTQQIIDAIYKSAQTGREVRFNKR